MSLPKLKTPTFDLPIPSSKKKVKFRPFIAKEEKILLMAKESGKEEEMVNAMEDIVKGCSFDVVDPKKLALFDIEFIFLRLRAKSIGEVSEINMMCKNKVAYVDELNGSKPPVDDDAVKECGGTIKFEIDLTEVEVVFDPTHKQNVMMDEEIGITFKYPTLDTVKEFESVSDTDVIPQIVSLIDSIFEGDDVHYAIDTPKKDLVGFVENLTAEQVRRIKSEFFDTMPMLKHTVKYTCSKCGTKDEYTFSGINDFF